MPISNARDNTARKTAIVLSALLVCAGPVIAETVERPPKPRPKPDLSLHSAPTGKLLVIPRSAWGAKPALFAMKAHKPVSILVHHTAGPVNAKRDITHKMRALQAYSQKTAKLGNGRKRAAWADVPYHFYISSNGVVAEGRAISFSGDTNTNYDPAGYIQVVLEGNFENTRPTTAQLAALEKLLIELTRKWQVPADRIGVHKDVASTLCPGKHLLDAFPALKGRVAARL